MRDIVRETADKYQDFFNFLSNEHGITATISEMDEILHEAQKLVNKLNERSSVAEVKEKSFRCRDEAHKMKCVTQCVQCKVIFGTE